MFLLNFFLGEVKWNEDQDVFKKELQEVKRSVFFHPNKLVWSGD